MKIRIESLKSNKNFIMITIDAEVISYYAGKSTPHMLLFWKENDQKCLENQTVIQYYILKYGMNLGLRALRTSWDGYREIFFQLEQITSYTVLYLYNGHTISGIEGPNAAELSSFKEKCFEARSQFNTLDNPNRRKISSSSVGNRNAN